MGGPMYHLPDVVLANHAPIRLPSSTFVPPFPGLATCSGLSLRTFRPTWSLPIASRLSRHLRFARSAPKSFPRAFSDAAAGIAAIPIGLNFPVLFQVVRPGRGGQFFPLDKSKLRQFFESHKQKMMGLSTGSHFSGAQVGTCGGQVWLQCSEANLRVGNWQPMRHLRAAIAPPLRRQCAPAIGPAPPVAAAGERSSG